MANLCVNVEPILECGKKPDNTKKSLEEKIKLEKLKHKQMRDRHRLKDQLKDERNALLPKLPRSFERLLHLLIKQALLKRPPKISTFFSQLLDKLLDCRIKQELGLSSSRLDLHNNEREPSDEEGEDDKEKFVDFEEEEETLLSSGVKLPLTSDPRSLKSPKKSLIKNKLNYSRQQSSTYKSGDDKAVVVKSEGQGLEIKSGNGTYPDEMEEGRMNITKSTGISKITATKSAEVEPSTFRFGDGKMATSKSVDGRISTTKRSGKTPAVKSSGVVSSAKSGSDKTLTSKSKALSKAQHPSKSQAELKSNEEGNNDKGHLDEIERCLEHQELAEIEEISEGRDLQQVQELNQQVQ